MLETLKKPVFSAGKSRASIARESGITVQTLWGWMKGRTRVPPYRRERLERSISAPGCVDWPAYDAEFEAHVPEPDLPPKIKAAGTATAPQARKAPSRWDDPPEDAPEAPPAPRQRPAPAKPAPTPAPPAPAPKKGLLARLIVDDGEDPFQ
jgi:transcriptional regulator with XRE-family HTH domain